jgi:ATP-dependent DNA helicase RecG
LDGEAKMNDRELESLLKNIESDRAERKESISDTEAIRRTICAFSNDLPDNRLPGVLFIGARDDGSCVGLTVDDRLLRRLSDMRDDGTILPLPHIEVKEETLSGCKLAVVIVHPSDTTPVRYRGRVYVRVGPTTRLASEDEERRLTEKRRSRDLPFDMRPLPSASLSDIDLDLFERNYLPVAVAPEILDQNTRPMEDQLASMRFLTPDKIPTVSGIIVLGKDARAFIPGAYIQFIRFDGKELTDPVKDQKEIDGPLPDLLRNLDEILKAHISVALEITSKPVSSGHPDYPIEALKQLTRNAVLHRTYEGTNAPVRISWFSDRIEIQNPGGPYGQVTKDNFGEPGITDYRNPQLAEAMKVLGYVQRFGVGIQIARQELVKNSNPRPEFQIESTYIIVTIRNRN